MKGFKKLKMRPLLAGATLKLKRKNLEQVLFNKTQVGCREKIKKNVPPIQGQLKLKTKQKYPKWV